MLKKLLFAVVLVGVSSFAYAHKDVIYAPVPLKGFIPAVYVGIQGGYGATNWNNIRNAPGSTQYSVSGSSAPTGRFYLGYNWRPHLAIEGGYTLFFNDTKIPNFIYNPKYSWALDAALKIKFHIVNRFGIYTKVGIDYFNTTLGNASKNNSVSYSAFNVLFGAGATYFATNNLSLDLSWTRFNGMDKWRFDYIPAADFYAIGLTYKFDLR